jgi:hypothetical protein
MRPAFLNEAESLLARHSPARFDTSIDAFPECIEIVRLVEDQEAWKGVYPSLEAFYAPHEDRHPDIRLYSKARREIATENPLTDPGGPPSKRLARLRREAHEIDRK